MGSRLKILSRVFREIFWGFTLTRGRRFYRYEARRVWSEKVGVRVRIWLFWKSRVFFSRFLVLVFREGEISILGVIFV